jgi:PD-(D/E)XK nuclease superfamily
MYHLVYRRQAYAKNAALNFGGALHEGLKAYFMGEPSEVQDQAILQYFAESPPPPDEYRTPQLALQVLKHYRVRSEFPDYQLSVLNDSAGTPIVERPFEIPLGVLDINRDVKLPSWPEPQFVRTIHVAWSGRIDILAKCNERDRVVDHKTTSVAGEQFIPSFQLSHQTQGYVWAAQQLWPELNINSFCLDAIYIKRPGANGYGSNLMSKGPRGGPPSLDFFRAYFDYTDSRLEQWEENTKHIVEDFVHCLVRGFFPMYTNHCFNKFGRCQYFDVCNFDDPIVRMRFLQSESFKDVTWSPIL